MRMIKYVDHKLGVKPFSVFGERNVPVFVFSLLEEFLSVPGALNVFPCAHQSKTPSLIGSSQLTTF